MVEAIPLVRVIGFDTTIERMAKRDENGNKVVDDKGNFVLADMEEHWVTYAPSHNPQGTQTRERVRHLMPSDNIRDAKGEKARFMNARWETIGPAYERFCKGQEIIVDGTPLGAWGGVSPKQAEALRAAGIRTVEEVRDLTDVQASKINLPRARDLPKLAKSFLENKSTSDADKKIADLEAKIETLLAERAETPQVDEEVAKLRAECDAKGIDYHHKAGVQKLRQLLAEEA